MEEAIRVMYLHTLRSSPHGERLKILKEACEPYRLIVPNLRTREALLLFTISFGTYLAFLVCLFVVSLFLFSFIISFLILIGMSIGVWTTYVLAGRGVTHYMVLRATAIAEEAFQEFRPNVIIASSFGTVIVFAMQVPKVSLILLAPGQDAYCRYLKKKRLPTLKGFPYVIIVHGSNDNRISLEDSIRLIDSSTYVQCKLEVIEDSHSLKSLTAADYREFIEEAYIKGKEQVIQIREKFLDVRPAYVSYEDIPFGDIDPGLFFINDTNDSTHRNTKYNLQLPNAEDFVLSPKSLPVPLDDESVTVPVTKH